MAGESERMQILQMIEDGRVTAAEGLRLLDALGSQAGAGATAEAAPDAAEPPPVPDLDRWRRWWIVPMWIGTGILLVGALLMYGAYQAGGFGFWFACATLPFLVGVVVMALAGFSQTARWLHIRVNTGQDEWPRKISISLPLPIGLTAWFLRTFGSRIPNLRETGVDELIMALGEHTSSKTPFYINVDEGQGGEQVQVYIG